MAGRFRSNLLERDRLALAGEVAYWLLMLAGCAVILILNIHTTLKEDDLIHTTVFGTDGREPVNNLLDLMRSLWNHYKWHDGRAANIPDFLFNGLLGKPLFNVCNTLMFGLMAHVVSRLSTGRNSVAVLAMLFAYIIAAWPVPGETLMWLAGSCNYLWSMTASLLFIAYLMHHRNGKPGWMLGIVVAVLSFLAGAANEGTTMGVGLGLVLYYLFNRRKVDRAVVIAMTAYLLGIVWLISSPGIWQRASSDIVLDAGPMQLLRERLVLLADRSVMFITPIVAAVLGLVAIVQNGVKKTFIDTPWAFIYLSMMAFVFAVGMFSLRMYCPVSLIAFIVMAMVLDYVFKRWRWLTVPVVIAGLAVCAYKVPSNIRTVKRYEAFFERAERDIKECDSPHAILKVHHFDGYSRFIKLFYLDSWNYYIYADLLCQHYGKKNIQFVSDSVYNRYHSGRLMDGASPVKYSTTHPGDVMDVFSFSDQDYTAVKMRGDSVMPTYQFAQTVDTHGQAMLPIFYYPLRYQDHVYYLFPEIGDTVSSVTFKALGLDREDVTVTLHPLAK